MTKKTRLAIDLAASLIDIGGFVGLDEESQNSLSEFISWLSRDEVEQLEKKVSSKNFDKVHSLFSIEAHNAALVLFEVEIPVQNKSLFDLSKLKVIGFVKNTIINNIHFEESSSIIYPYTCKVIVVSEIDHEKIREIEKTSASIKELNKDFSIYFPFEDFKFTKKFI